MKFLKSNKGTTLIELTITLAILAIISGLATSMFINIHNIQIKAVVKKEVQEEMRSLMEKIVQDIRNRSIDYRGYYIMNWDSSERPAEANRDEANAAYIGYPNPFPTGGDILNPAPDFIPTKNESILLLLSSDGKERIKYRTYDFDGDGTNDTLMMSKQTYSNSSSDICHSLPEVNYSGSHDWDPTSVNPDFCWVLDDGFGNIVSPYYGYLPISNPNIKITDLQFYFQVQKDPFKVYEEDEIQLQPMVTIKMTGEYNIGDEVIVGGTPQMTLQTTVSARYYEETRWSTL